MIREIQWKERGKGSREGERKRERKREM